MFIHIFLWYAVADRREKTMEGIKLYIKDGRVVVRLPKGQIPDEKTIKRLQQMIREYKESVIMDCE